MLNLRKSMLEAINAFFDEKDFEHFLLKCCLKS